MSSILKYACHKYLRALTATTRTYTKLQDLLKILFVLCPFVLLSFCLIRLIGGLIGLLGSLIGGLIGIIGGLIRIIGGLISLICRLIGLIRTAYHIL